MKKLEVLVQNRKTKTAYFNKRGRLESSPSESENTIATGKNIDFIKKNLRYIFIKLLNA